MALGFAPYVGRIVGVDPEPAMLVATKKAADASKAITLIESKAEALPSDVAKFDVVTIGRALHWMDVDAVGSLFKQNLQLPKGLDSKSEPSLKRLQSDSGMRFGRTYARMMLKGH